jgi:hypothetical protein
MPKPRGATEFEAQLREELAERGPLDYRGVQLVAGEWTPITAEQAAKLSTVPGVRIRAAKKEAS